MENVIEKTEPKVKKTRRLPGCNLPIPGPGRNKMTPEERQKKEIIKKSKEEIIKYLEKQGYGAAQRIVKISKTSADKYALAANKDILDRVGVGVQKNNIGVAVQVNFRDNDLQ